MTCRCASCETSRRLRALLTLSTLAAGWFALWGAARIGGL